MGTDIHAFVEVDDDSRDEPLFSAESRIRPLNYGELFIRRDYALFDALGDGRNYHFQPEDNRKRGLYPPRGLPTHFGSAVLNRFFHVVDDHGYENLFYPSLRALGTEEADKWLAQGISHLGKPLEIIRERGPERLRRVSDPDWHSASWLMLHEIYQALEHYGIRLESSSIDVRIILNVMEQFEAELGKGRTRLVFWFDN